MKIYLLIVSLLLTTGSYAQFEYRRQTHIEFEEKQQDTLHTTLDSILVIGMGSNATKMFLSDLSDVMIQKLGAQQIKASYQYLGKTSIEAEQEFKAMNKASYKFILFLSPKGSDISGKIRTRHAHTTPSQNGPNVITTEKERVTYHQLYDFQLCKADASVQMFWNAEVNIDCDPTKKYAAKKLSTKLLSRFKEVGYIK